MFIDFNNGKLAESDIVGGQFQKENVDKKLGKLLSLMTKLSQLTYIMGYT